MTAIDHAPAAMRARRRRDRLRLLMVLPVIATVVLGEVMGGWLGALTTIFGLVGAGIGWGMIRPASDPGGLVQPPLARRVQRIAGVVGTLGLVAGLVVGGWRWGWLWGCAGGCLGMLALHLLRRRLGPAAMPVEIPPPRLSVESIALLERIGNQVHPADPDALPATGSSGYDLWDAARQLARAVASDTSYLAAVTLSGVSGETIDQVLTEAGYDMDQLTADDREQRLAYESDASRMVRRRIEERLNGEWA